MKGVFYRIKDRSVVVEDVPAPVGREGGVLIKTLYSAISPGTEGSTVSLVKGGPIKILRERREQVMSILKVARDYGMSFLINKVKGRSNLLTPLGYSLSGVVIEDYGEFKKGDLVVAVGGEFANHCEVVWVPKNLVVKASRKDKMKELSFGALVSIALHAVRRSGISGGESAAVIGLGIIGQIIARILKIWDVAVVGLDKDEFRMSVAKKDGIDLLSYPYDGRFDVVFITAPDKTGEVVNLAGKLLRDRGKVIAVADANFSFNWKTYYYKELEILISRSYGPGRYDPEYEYEGRDYPVGYVRWTERRNLEYAVRLIESDKLNLNGLITHEFSIDEAEKAYDLITKKSEPFIGIVLKYGEADIKKRVYIVRSIKKKGKYGVAFIGAGNYAQGFLIPEIKKLKDCQLVAVATLRGHTARSVAETYGFPVFTTDYREILKMDEVDVVFITTTHSTHGSIALEALKSGKAVFVEKPLAINLRELKYIEDHLNDKGGYLTVGFNRRFSPHAKFLKDRITKPFQMNYLVDAGKLDRKHWIFREGGRLLGEAIHFVDFAIFLANEEPSNYEIIVAGDGGAIILTWKDGSIANILYGTYGGKIKKEEITVMCADNTIKIEDFRSSYDRKGSFKTRTIDKGQRNMLKEFFGRIKEGEPLIPYWQIFSSHRILLSSSTP